MEQPFNDADRNAVYRAIYERRDMRHFLRDPVAPEVMTRLIDAALHAPSVGYMQPWRVVRITCPTIREKLYGAVDRERSLTADALGDRGNAFMKLKVEGLRDCAEVLVIALMEGRESYIFGRRTLPEMDLASVACGIQNMWLAARAEGLGMGWVSLFDPNEVAIMLAMPPGAIPVAILCIGHVREYYPAPMLAIEGWTEKRAKEDCIFEDQWNQSPKEPNRHAAEP